MNGVQNYDMYDFIDDGRNKSIYTILSGYHPNLNKDFSLANLINHMQEIGTTQAQIDGYRVTYEKHVVELINLLREKNKESNVAKGDEERLSDEEKQKMIDEFRVACKEIPECESFVNLEQYLELAKKTMSNADMKPLRDIIVTNATRFLSKESTASTRSVLLKSVYLAKALWEAKKVNHKSREPGEYPEVDRLNAINQILQKNNGIEEYDEFYEEASEQIKAAALKAMEKARIDTVCKRKRAIYVKKAINPSISSNPQIAKETPISDIFERIKRVPVEGENDWSYESLKEPELLCDLNANYSENGIENQRVIAFRYGKLKHKNSLGNVDRTAEMPELIGISRIGNDGTKTYFVLMPPIDRLTFRSIDDQTQEPGDRPYGFTITQDVEVPTSSGKTRIERQTAPANIVDGKTGQRLRAFKNSEIPEHLKDFYAKVFFSDEYLSNAIKNNARYIGSIAEKDDSPKISTSDIEKYDLATAHYATYHPGTIDGRFAKNFEAYCDSFELKVKQYNLIKAYQRKIQKDQKPNKNDGAR